MSTGAAALFADTAAAAERAARNERRIMLMVASDFDARIASVHV